MMNFGVISLMPEMFKALNYGVTGRAIENKQVRVEIWNPRDWAKNPHRQVDDKPYGGGPGMVMMYEPLHAAINFARERLGECRTIYLSPQGQVVTQSKLNAAAKKQTSLLLLAGRYEGIDERVINNDVDEEWSVGDYVLSGGELAAMVLIDAIVRQIPGTLGHQDSAGQDSFMEGLLDHPHYTRPAEINGMDVPAVLMQGNHRDIIRWRRKQSLGQTWLKRPDLLEKFLLSDSDMLLLKEFKREHGDST